MGLLAPERQQIGDARDAVHEPAASSPRRTAGAAPGAAPSRTARRGRDDAGDAQPQRRGPGESRRESGASSSGEQAGDGDGRQARPESRG